jgi:hypothetical protein
MEDILCGTIMFLIGLYFGIKSIEYLENNKQ